MFLISQPDTPQWSIYTLLDDPGDQNYPGDPGDHVDQILEILQTLKILQILEIQKILEMLEIQVKNPAKKSDNYSFQQDVGSGRPVAVHNKNYQPKA